MVTINTESALTPRSLRDTRRMNMFVSVAAAVAGLLFGLDIGVIAGALPFITDHFVLTSRLQEWVVSSMMLGAAIGALFNAFIYQTIVRNGGFPAHSSQQTNCFHSSLLMCVTATRLNKERDKRLNGQVPDLY